MKVFGKVESERMPVRKVWDHAIDLKEDFNYHKWLLTWFVIDLERVSTK